MMISATKKRTGYSTSHYTRHGDKNYTYSTPYSLTAHKFALDIPTDARVDSIVFEVRMKTDPGIRVAAPTINFRCYNGTNASYFVKSGKFLSHNWFNFTYTIGGDEFRKRAYPINQINSEGMGIDLIFQEPTKMTSTPIGVYLDYVRVKVNYTLPQYYLKVKQDWLDPDNPKEINVNSRFKLDAEFGNKTTKDGGEQEVYLKLPFGVDLEEYEMNGYCTFEQVEVGTYLWTCRGVGVHTLSIKARVKTIGLKNNYFQYGSKKYHEYVYGIGFWNDDYGQYCIDNSDLQFGQEGCFQFSTKVLSQDDEVTFEIDVDNNDETDNSKFSDTLKAYYNVVNSNDNYLVNWQLEEETANKGIYIESSDNNHITFKGLTPNQTNEIRWTGCFLMTTEGTNYIRLTNQDTSDDYMHEYKVQAYEQPEVTFDCGDLIWYNHRLLTEVDLEGYIVPFASSPYDNYMVQGDCNLHMDFWENVSYIGPVPLKHTHYDPKSTYKNDLLKESYKNKTYMGKKGEIDEDISLNIKLPPADVTTLQGLCKVDKPIPINTVPYAFEGDALNHRGWVELTKVTAEKTNPLWYKTELDVTYLTHDIHTRFEILRGKKIHNYTLPNHMEFVLESGDEFAEYTYIKSNGSTATNGGYFTVETDGSYIYDDDEDTPDNQRTLITMDNGQHITMTSVEALPNQAIVNMEWNSTKINEDRENNVERIIQILNGKGRPIMEYQYSDFSYNTIDEYYSCMVTCRVLRNHQWITVISEEMNLAVDVESLDLLVDNNGNVYQQSEVADTSTDEEFDNYVYNDYCYGSKLNMEFDGKVLTLVDEGYNGREIYKEIELDKGRYYYRVAWKNHNTDGETNDVLTFFDFEVKEPILISEYSGEYNNMLVSSFPIAQKELLFTRNSEEGTIFYYRYNKERFTYLLEPFYMYYCGVDLKSREGVSLVDLNNSHTTVYIQNGLVRIGFNRLNGEIYLSKYDLKLKEYINVALFQLTNFTHFTLGDYSDDKISMKCGTTQFTVYRGHPYVVVYHPDENMKFETHWSKIWSESVNDDAYSSPVFWDLRNHDNLLPTCVGAENISSSCITVDDDYEDEDVGTVPTLTLTQTTNPIYLTEEATFTVSGNVSDIDEEVPIESNYYGVFGAYKSKIQTDNSKVYRVILNYTINVEDEEMYLTSKVEDYDRKLIAGKTVTFYNGSTSLGTATTNDYGIAQLTETLEPDIDVKAVCDGVESEIKTVVIPDGD